eukprot:9069072-Pyramimonas_sp.AAC.1
MRTSNLLRSYEIIDSKKQLEEGGQKQSKTSVADYYGKLTMVKSSENVTPTFVENLSYTSQPSADRERSERHLLPLRSAGQR